MRIGKLSESVWKRSVLRMIEKRKEEVVIPLKNGVQAAAYDLEEQSVAVQSSAIATDSIKMPIIRALNDLAAAGSEPAYISLVSIVPGACTEQELRDAIKEADQVCASLGVELLHVKAEVSRAVKKAVYTVNATGKAKKESLLKPSSLKAGQDIVVANWVGLEATSLIASEKNESLKARFSESFLHTAIGFSKYASLKDACKVASAEGALYMHAAAEGGIFSALWELAEAGTVGLRVDARAIPIRQETIEICEFFHINPYLSLSTGALLITASDGDRVVHALEAQGIHAALIGKTTDTNDRILQVGTEIRYLDRPQEDEIFKVLEV